MDFIKHGRTKNRIELEVLITFDITNTQEIFFEGTPTSILTKNGLLEENNFSFRV